MNYIFKTTDCRCDCTTLPTFPVSILARFALLVAATYYHFLWPVGLTPVPVSG